MSIVVSVIAAIVVTLGFVVWYGRQKAYLARKGESLRESAGDLAKETADEVSDALHDAAKNISGEGGVNR